MILAQVETYRKQHASFYLDSGFYKRFDKQPRKIKSQSKYISKWVITSNLARAALPKQGNRTPMDSGPNKPQGKRRNRVSVTRPVVSQANVNQL